MSQRPDDGGRPARVRRGWHAYILRCADGTLYSGATNDLEARIARHAAGKGARYTRSRLPVELAWNVRAGDRSAALRREAALKRLTRAEKLALVKGASSLPKGAGRSSSAKPKKSGTRRRGRV